MFLQYHAIACNVVQYHAIPSNVVQYHAIPCTVVQYHAIACIIEQYHAILCNIIQHNAISYNDVQYHTLKYPVLSEMLGSICVSYYLFSSTLKQRGKERATHFPSEVHVCLPSLLLIEHQRCLREDVARLLSTGCPTYRRLH